VEQAAPKKPREVRCRLVLPVRVKGQQFLFSFQDGFSKGQRISAADALLKARRSDRSVTVEVPCGMHVHVRGDAADVWHPLEPVRGSGQPRKLPRGTWEDDDLLEQIKGLVGNVNNRDQLEAEAFDSVIRLAAKSSGRSLTSDESKALRRLIYGVGGYTNAQPGPAQRGRRQLGDDNPIRPAAPSVIARQILAWRYSLTDADVRRMQKSLRNKTRKPTEVIFR